MQVPKEEIRADILRAAEHEFFIHGYKASSMRTIARKANTTLGNLYHYFANKEAILEALVGDVPDQIREAFATHQEVAQNIVTKEMDLTDISLLGAIFEQWLPEYFRFDLLLSNVVIILLEGCEGTKYEPVYQEIYDIFKMHMSEHVDAYPESTIKNKELFTDTIVQTIIFSIIHIAKTMPSLEDGIATLIKFIKMVLLGMMSEMGDITSWVK